MQLQFIPKFLAPSYKLYQTNLFTAINLEHPIHLHNFIPTEIGLTPSTITWTISVVQNHSRTSQIWDHIRCLSLSLGHNDRSEKSSGDTLFVSLKMHFLATVGEYVSNTYRDLTAPCVICLFSVRLYRRVSAFARQPRNFQAEFPRACGEKPWKCLSLGD